VGKGKGLNRGVLRYSKERLSAGETTKNTPWVYRCQVETTRTKGVGEHLKRVVPEDDEGEVAGNAR